MATINQVPYEVLAGPVEVYIGEVGATKPLVTEDPAAEEWSLVGTRGSRNYDEEGVSIAHPQTQKEWYALGSTAPIKVFRSQESQSVKVTLVDVSLEQYALALNDNEVTSEAGIRSIGLTRGPGVKQYALLVRGDTSPYGDGLRRQYHFPRVYEGGSHEVKATKDTPQMLNLEFKCLEDFDAEDATRTLGELSAEDGSS